MPNRLEAQNSITNHFLSVLSSIPRKDTDGNVIQGNIRHVVLNQVLDPDAEWDEEWVRFIQRHNDTRQATIGTNPRFDTIGNVIWQVMTPDGYGDCRTSEISNMIRTGYVNHRTPEGVYFLNFRELPVGVLDGTHFQTDIYIDFEYDT